MKRALKNYIGMGNIKKEFKRQLRLLIIITLGFTIAFTWRQTIFDLSLALVSFVTNVQNDATLSMLSSALITIISIGLIYLTSYWLKDRPDSY